MRKTPTYLLTYLLTLQTVKTKQWDSWNQNPTCQHIYPQFQAGTSRYLFHLNKSVYCPLNVEEENPQISVLSCISVQKVYVECSYEHNTQRTFYVDLVKCYGPSLVGEIRRYKNDRYHYYYHSLTLQINHIHGFTHTVFTTRMTNNACERLSRSTENRFNAGSIWNTIRVSINCKSQSLQILCAIERHYAHAISMHG